MGGPTGCGGIWVLFWWVGPCSVNILPKFLLMGGAVFPPYCLAWGQDMVGVMVTSFKRTYVRRPRSSQDCCIQCSRPRSRPLSTYTFAGDSWILTHIWPAHSLVGSLFLSPGFLCIQILFVPSKSLFPHSCGILFCHKNISICDTMYGPKGYYT